MPYPRRSARVLAVAVAAAVPVAVASASPVTVGENFIAGTACDGITVVKTVPGGSTSYVVPADGVITSWSTNAESGGNRMAAVVYRQVGGDYVLVGISATQVPVGSGLKTYSTNIPVLQGDLFGSWVETRNGNLSVDKTCSGGASGFTTSWWYDSPNNVLPPTTTVSIAGIGSSLTGNANDAGWRYDISGELGDPAPPTPDTPQAPTTPSTSSGSAAPVPTAATPPAVSWLVGRWTRPSARGVVRSSGTVPAGATRLTQSARPVGGGAAALQDFLEMAGSAPRTGSCSISGTVYRCTIRLGAGRWTITTQAFGAGGVVAQSTRRVVVRRAAAALPVTG